jgi:UDP-glucose:(heptosyl)LPS alpha-1,3-glucosyltransferase
LLQAKPEAPPKRSGYENRRMRIALNYFWVDPARGGAETYVCDLARKLVETGHEVSLYANGWHPDALPAAVRCIRVDAPGRVAWARIWNFAQNSARALAGAPYDCTVGFINTWYHDVIIPQAGLRAASLEHNARRFPPGMRTLYRLAKRANPKYWVYQAIERKQYDRRRPVLVVAPSKMVERHLWLHYENLHECVRVVPNAIDVARLQVADPAAARAALRRRLGLREDDLVALFVGHNPWLKGLKPLLAALGQRLRDKPEARPVHLIACGGGPVEPFKAMARRLRLDGRVHLLGFVEDVRECYWASDFFVLPTYYDPCSLVLFEALACGLPVITTRFNGAGETIRNGREGFVISSPGARSELIAAIEKIAEADDFKRGWRSRKAMQMGHEQSFDLHFSRIMEVFEEVVWAKKHGAWEGVYKGPHQTCAEWLQREEGTVGP